MNIHLNEGKIELRKCTRKSIQYIVNMFAGTPPKPLSSISKGFLETLKLPPLIKITDNVQLQHLYFIQIKRNLDITKQLVCFVKSVKNQPVRSL